MKHVGSRHIHLITPWFGAKKVAPQLAAAVFWHSGTVLCGDYVMRDLAVCYFVLTNKYPNGALLWRKQRTVGYISGTWKVVVSPSCCQLQFAYLSRSRRISQHSRNSTLVIWFSLYLLIFLLVLRGLCT